MTEQPQRYRSPANRIRYDQHARAARIADRVTALFGSWPFILYQTLLIAVWLTYNGYVAVQLRHGGAFDPYPFILLNLLFSTQAAYAAPLILLSQNRTSERDRVKAEHDFDVNILALLALSELLADTRNPEVRKDLLGRVKTLLGNEPP